MPTLSISSEKVCYLIVKAREYDVQDAPADTEAGPVQEARRAGPAAGTMPCSETANANGSSGQPQSERFRSPANLQHDRASEVDRHLLDIRLLRIHLGQRLQSGIERQQLRPALLADHQRLIHRRPLKRAARLPGLATTGVIDHDAAHELRGDPEEVRAILPGDIALVHQANVRFVNERRGLSGWPGHPTRRWPPALRRSSSYTSGSSKQRDRRRSGRPVAA